MCVFGCRRHHHCRTDGADAELPEDEVGLEGLALAFSSPHTEDERDLDFRQLHEVLGEVHDNLVHEGRRDVEVVIHVVHAAHILEALRNVVIALQDGILCARRAALRALEERVHHAAAANDVLLVVRDVLIEALPLVRGHLQLCHATVCMYTHKWTYAFM